MADMGGLLGFSGLDEDQQRMAVANGLLGLGSGLLANQYYDPRTGQGGLTTGLSQGAQAMMAAPAQVRQQAYQDAVMKQKLQEFQLQQKRQEAMQKYVDGLAPDDPRRQAFALSSPDKIGETLLKGVDRRDEANVNLEYKPKIAAAEYNAVTPFTLQRKAGEGQIENQNRISLEQALSPILVNRSAATAGADASARNAVENAPINTPYGVMPQGQWKAMQSQLGQGLGSATPVTLPGGVTVPLSQVGKASEDQYKKQQGAQSVAAILDQIEPMTMDEKTGQMVPDLKKSILNRATHSGLGAAADWAGGLVGVSTPAADAAAQLKVLGSALMMGMPRMEGPQSDKDVALYREAAGNISDPSTPVSQKRAAMQTIRALNARYSSPQPVANGGWGIRPVGGQ